MKLIPFDPPSFRIEITAPRHNIIVKTPTVADYYKMLATKDYMSTALYICKKYAGIDNFPFSAVTAADFIRNYLKALDEYKEINLDYTKIPEKKDYTKYDEKNEFPQVTNAQHMVYTYSGIDFERQLEMCITEYWIILADAVKTRYSETEQGREYLEAAYIDMHCISTLEANILD